MEEDKEAERPLLSSSLTMDDESFRKDFTGTNLGLIDPQTTITRLDIFVLLISGAMGSGILCIPFIMMQSGLLLTAGLLVLVAILTWLSVYIAISTSMKLEIYHLGEICRKLYGQGGRYAVDGMLIFGYFCALLSYLVTLGTTAASVMTTIVDPINEAGNVNWLTRPAFNTIILVLTFVLPSSLIKVTGAGVGAGTSMTIALIILSKVSFLLILTALTFLIAGSQQQSTFYFTTHARDDLSELNLYSWTAIVRSIGVILFAFSFSTNIFHAYCSLPQRGGGGGGIAMYHISLYSILTCLVLNFATGVCGYLAFVEETRENILYNLNSQNEFLSLVNAIKIAVILHLLVYIPRELLVMKCCIYDSLGWTEGITDIAHVTLTLCILFQGVCIALFLEKTTHPFYKVVSLSGGLSGSMITFVVPGLMGMTTYKAEYNGKRAESFSDLLRFVTGLILFLVGITVFLASTYVNVAGLD